MFCRICGSKTSTGIPAGDKTVHLCRRCATIQGAYVVPITTAEDEISNPTKEIESK